MNVGAAGMEFASEFLIEATRNSLRITEVPIPYRGRSGGEPKLRTFRDGWRHLSLMVTESRRPMPDETQRYRRAGLDRNDIVDQIAKESG